MKPLKILGLLATTAAALVAFVETASATTVTSSTGSTPTIHAVTPVNATIITHTAVGTISCDSTFTMQIQSHGVGVTASGPVTTWSFTNCSGGTVHTINAQGHIASPGTLVFHAAGSTGNAIVTSTGLTISKTMFGVECGYSTNNTSIGELEGSENAILKLSGSIPRTHGSFFCGSTTNWTGEFKVTHPADLTFH